MASKTIVTYLIIVFISLAMVVYLLQYSTYRHLLHLTTNFTHSNNADYLVPNVVHYVWFLDTSKRREFNFVNYVSVLSVYKIQKPEKIIFHCDVIPNDKWWIKAWNDFQLTVERHDPVKEISGKKIDRIEHVSDIARLEILLKNGGIYLDCDVIVVRSLDPLRRYAATIAKEHAPKFNAGTILAMPNSTFLRLWYESYKRDFQPDQWVYNSGEKPYQIYLKHQHLLHVENTTFSTPPGKTVPQMFRGLVDWSSFYTVHIMYFDKHYTPKNIKYKQTTFCQALRYIYYNHKEPFPSGTQRPSRLQTVNSTSLRPVVGNNSTTTPIQSGT